MSAGELTVTVCPECAKPDSVDLGDGNRLCLGCRHEWNPADPELVARHKAAALEHERQARVDTVLGPDPADHLADALEAAVASPDELDGDDGTGEPVPDWSGKFVRDTLHPDRGVLLVTVDDGGRGLELQDSRGVGYIASRDACTYLGDDPAGPGVDVTEGGDAGIVPLAPVIFAVAGLALEAGVDSVGEGPDPELYDPRIGWLPPPCDGLPEAEQGIAYAVAILIRHFDLDRETVRQLAAGLLLMAQGPETETEQ